MRAALINPPDPGDRTAEDHAPPPLGICSIAAYTRANGFDVDLFDLADFGAGVPGHVRDQLAGYDVVGFTSYTKTFPAALIVARAIREKNPNVWIVLGGPHATPCADELIAGHPEIDFVIKHDGEAPFLELLREMSGGAPQWDAVPDLVWRRPDGTPAHSPAPAPTLLLDDFPLPARDFVIEPDRESYETRWRPGPGRRAFLTSTRGCPKRCTFCSIIVMAPKWRFRSASNVLRELRELAQTQPIEHVAFMDANFFVDTRRAVEISDALWEWDPRITFSGTATADHVVRHESAIAAIARNCLFLEIGIESGSDSVLLRFGKRTTVQQNLQAIGMLRKYGIALDLDFIMFDPWTTLEELQENLAFLDATDLLGYHPADCLLNPLKIYPGTIAHGRAIEEFGLRQHHMMELLPPFTDSRVAAVYRVMACYRDDFKHRTEAAMLLAQEASRNAESSRTRLDAARLVVQLSHAPYRLFAECVEAAAGDGGPASLVATSEGRRLLRLIAEAESFSPIKEEAC